MDRGRLRIAFCAGTALLALSLVGTVRAQRLFPTVMPEARTIRVRDPATLTPYRMPQIPSPSTVLRSDPATEPREMSLDEAIRVALVNEGVVRVLAGTTAVASGQTIYSTAIQNTAIDDANARFDPNVSVTNSWNRVENPIAAFDPLNPGRSLIGTTQNDNYNLNVNVDKRNATGGVLNFGVNTNPTRLHPNLFPLDPSNRSATSLSYTQPLLKGGGIGPNMALIVVARLDTERSYFQFKDSVQQQVRGVAEAYWALVFARTDVWARRRQVETAAEAVRRIEARVKVEFDNRADLAQARVSLATFRVQLVTAEANMLQREAALRNILGLPPSDMSQVVPTTPPNTDLLEPNWDALLELAAERRPDIIELKLILEADQQLIMQARNNALPQLDAVALYRWNGLSGIMQNGDPLASRGGQFTDWTLGVNFSVPLGLRQARAGLRRRELLLAQDRVNLEQGLFSASHDLATSVRSLARAYAQYQELKIARAAARVNLNAQVLRYRTGQAILINVLQAITDWGNAVSAEANALADYNTQLANLELQTGTILESHGITFSEEQYGSISPLGRLHKEAFYPSALRPNGNDDRYGAEDQPAEKSFNLELPPSWKDRSLRLPEDVRPDPPQEIPTPAPNEPQSSRRTTPTRSASQPGRAPNY